ncbi:MAG: hypothetical protein AB7E67_16420, partial [Xanthobacteraceae bacterium]
MTVEAINAPETATPPRSTARRDSIIRATITLVAAAALYELVARSGQFAPALLPKLETIGRALWI